MNPILVTSAGESTGKTAVALALALAAREAGHDVGYMKPKGTRLQSSVGKTLDEDPMLAREVLDLDAPIHELEPIVYSPTFVQEVVRGREDTDALREQVRTSFESLAADHDLMIVEGGGLVAGAAVDLTDGDIAALLDARVVLVAPYAEPRDVDTVVDAADRFGDRLGGVLFNGVNDAAYDDLTTDVVPFLEGRGIRVLGTVPREQALAGVTVEELAEEVGATLLTQDAPTGTFLERFIVGAMGATEALTQFRRTRDALLITGGDRSELQAAALDAPGIEAILLTGGMRPSGALLGRAEDAGVPVLVVQSDTTTAIERVEAILRAGRARDRSTVEEMSDLLATYADVDAALAIAENS
jgi:hypothetical protein